MRIEPKLKIVFLFLVVLLPLVFAEIRSTNYKITSYAIMKGKIRSNKILTKKEILRCLEND